MPLPGHYQYRESPGWVAAAATIAVLIVILLAVTQIRLLRDRTVVQFAAPDATAQQQGPTLQVQPDAFLINGQAVAPGDVLYRLSSLADGRVPLMLESAPEVDAARVTQALLWANQAGFTNVAVRLKVQPDDTNP